MYATEHIKFQPDTQLPFSPFALASLYISLPNASEENTLKKRHHHVAYWLLAHFIFHIKQKIGRTSVTDTGQVKNTGINFFSLLYVKKADLEFVKSVLQNSLKGTFPFTID